MGHRLSLCGCRGSKLLRGLQGGSLPLEELPGSWRHARVFPLLRETGWEEVSSASFGVFIFVSFFFFAKCTERKVTAWFRCEVLVTVFVPSESSPQFAL